MQKNPGITAAVCLLIFIGSSIFAPDYCSCAQPPADSEKTFCYLDALDALYEYFCAAELGVEVSAPAVTLEVGNSCDPPLWARLLSAAAGSFTSYTSGGGNTASSSFSSGPTTFAVTAKCSLALMRNIYKDLYWVVHGGVGDPVDLVTGANHQIFKDLDVSVPRVSLPLAFERYYNSQNVRAGAMGKSWSHAFEISIRALGELAYVYKDPRDGKLYKLEDDAVQDSLELLTAEGRHRIFVPLNGVYAEQDRVEGSTVIKNPDETYDWKRSDKSVYHFDPAGNLVSITDRNDQSLTLTYTAGRLGAVRDPTDRAVYQLTYNSSGTVASVTDVAGRTVNYFYTGNLLTKVSALNGETLFEYGGDTSDLLTARTDPTGARTVWTYSAIAPESSMQGGGNYMTSSGCGVVFADLVSGVSLSSAADVNRAVLQGWYGTSGSGYGAGASTERFLPGDPSQFECSDGAADLSGGYSLFKSPSSSVPPVSSPRSKVLTLSEQGSASGFTANYYYDAGRSTDVVVVQDNHGRASIYERTQAGSSKQLTAMSNPLGQSARMNYDSAGRVAAAVGTQGETYQFSYDAAGNVSIITDPLGNAISLLYDPGLSDPIRVTNARGYATNFSYDAKGRPISMTNALGHTAAITYNAQGQPAVMTDFMNYQAQRVYDAYGRMTTVTDPLGRATQYAYDALGRMTSLTSPGNRSATFTYNDRDELTSLTDPLAQTVNFSYRPADSALTQVSDARANSTLFNYDAEGRLTSETNALGQTQSMTYDDLGRLTKTVLKDGSAREISYDDRDRPVSILLADEQLSYVHDDARLTKSAENGEAKVEMLFDVLGRLSTMRHVDKSDNTGYEINYAYDGEGNRTSMLTPFGNFSYTYDALNHLASLTNFKGQSMTFAYDDNSRLTQMSYPNGVTTAFSYDAAGAVTGIEAAKLGVVIASNSYAYSPDHEVLSMADFSGTHNFGYDAAGRLTSASHPDPGALAYKSESYAYDPASNRSSSHRSATYAYDAANRLVSDSSFTYTFDARGDMTSRTETATGNKTIFTYNARNLLSSVEDQAAGRKTAYRYDPLSRRISKTITLGAASQSWKYFYDGADILAISVKNRDEDGNITTQDVAFTRAPAVDRPLILHAGEDYFYHADKAGSIVALSDAGGAVVERAEYESFGKAVFIDPASGGTRPVSAVTANPFAFQGRELDGESGLYHYRSRTLDAGLGRFLQEDPVWKANRYRYAANNPLSYTDPMGTDEGDKDDDDEDLLSAGSHWAGDIGKMYINVGKTFSANKSFTTASKITKRIYDVNTIAGILDPYVHAAMGKIPLQNAADLGVIKVAAKVGSKLFSGLKVGYYGARAGAIFGPWGAVAGFIGGSIAGSAGERQINGVMERWLVYQTGNRGAYKRIK